MQTSTFKPFESLSTPFTISLKPLDNQNFLHVDDECSRYLNEKRALYASQFDDVFMAEEGTDQAQQEVYDLICKALDKGSDIPELPSLPPLAAAALMVQDDLLLMRKDEQGWRLVAGSLCFPSSWTLSEKFGKPMERIHDPVPHMEGKMGSRINRIFDALQPQSPLWRQNWGMESDGLLRHDRLERMRKLGAMAGKLKEEFWLRCEYQTLHKLPLSGDILFTVKVLPKSLEEISGMEGGPELLAVLKQQFMAMSPGDRLYKGIHEGSERLLEWLEVHALKEKEPR